ncbi:MAG: hypothetical protein M3397_11735 [Actinomycetota bacterium]|jgi:hypothetical protein|nr:hypothetical protein [Rubrobacter sp.]MDQ3568735.1 hypothetical protein [Actinomycetota bacterium]
MALAVREILGSLADEERRQIVYDGDLLVFKAVSPMREFCAFTDALIRESLDTGDPVRAQFEMDRDDYLARIETLQKRFREHEDAKRLFLAALESTGVDLGRICWDWLYLRVLPSGEEYASGRAAKLGHHRDTWSSNVYSQTNWWAPIYPITAGRTLAFYPDYWSRPLNNTSGVWDLEEVRVRRRAGEPVALVPEPEEPVDTASELRPVISPGDLLCFSGAHLHASVPNATGIARFSVEARTVDTGDAALNVGAPNVDGASPRVALNWFREVRGGASLAEAADPRET